LSGGIFLRLILLTSFIFIAGCSLYQSDGRKFLEKQALDYAGVSAQTNLQGCANETMSEDWQKASETEDAVVLISDKEEFLMRVMPTARQDGYVCSFKFASAQEMVERTDSAIAITLIHLGQSLGEFAFLSTSPVK
jgi:hypothetical protein